MPNSRRPALRAGFAAVSAAAVLVAGGSLAADAAGKAKPVLAGKNNKATKTTKLTNKKAGPALSLKTKSGPALAVNTNSLIPNLNADLLDGKSAEVLSPTAQTFTFGTAGMTGSGTSIYFQTTQLPSGTYEFFLGGSVTSDPGDNSQCAILDGTRFINSGGADNSAIYIYDSIEGGGGAPDQFSGHFVGPVVAGNRLVFGCNIDSATQLVQPVQFTIRKIDGATAIPGVGPTGFPRGVGSILGAR